MNPATWMLEVIGAGTSVAAASANSTITDFHIHYNQSALCELNLSRLDHFIRPNEGSKKVQTWTQFRLLMHRIALTYWRTSTYSLFRHFTYVIIALIFASAYLPNQKYETYVAATSRAAVIYIYYSFVLWYFIDVNKFRSGKNVMKELGEISIINPEKNEIRTYMYIGFLSK
jgi:hypothetical protein